MSDVDPCAPAVLKYFSAAAKWEDFVLQLAMALDAYRWINGGEGAFTRADGSKEYRLYTMANQIKHTTSCIDSGQCSAADVLPLWMTSHALVSFGQLELSYAEAAQILTDAAELADAIQNPTGFVDSAPTPEPTKPTKAG